MFPDTLIVPFTTGVDKVGEAVAAAAARTLERREVAVLVGEVLISISSIVAGLGGISYWVGVMPKRSSIRRNWVSASLHLRCLIFISSVCPCCSCSCWRKEIEKEFPPNARRTSSLIS